MPTAPLSKKAALVAHMVAGSSFRDAALAAGLARETAFTVIQEIGARIDNSGLPNAMKWQDDAVPVYRIRWRSLVRGVQHAATVYMSTCTGAMVGFGVGATEEAADSAALSMVLSPNGIRAAAQRPASLLFDKLHYWKRIDQFRAVLAVACADFNLCRADDDGTTPAMRAGTTKLRWTLEEVLAVVLGGAIVPRAEASRAALGAEARMRVRAREAGMVVVFGQMIPMRDLAMLSGRKVNSIASRMRLFNMTPEQAAFGE